MPTFFTWHYEATPATAARGGEQRCEAGDRIIVPNLGDCTLDRVDGVGEGRIVRAQHKVGETVTIHEVPAATVYAYVSKRAANEPRTKTGRSGKNMGDIASLLGNGPATPTLVEGRAAGGRGSGSGRGGAFGKRKKKDASSAAPAVRQRTSTAEQEPRQDEPETPAPVTTLSSLLGAEYADDDDDDESAAPAPASARQPKLQFRAKSAEEKSEYKRGKYEEKKEQSQKDWLDKYGSWLDQNALYGAHCKVCIKASVKAADKLSSTGYCFVGEGEERKMAPIPSEQKLKEHEAKSQHKHNMRQAELMKAGGQQQGVSSMKVYTTVTSEDELYFRTIRTVHSVVIRLNSLNDIRPLLELQNANGMVISFDHIHMGGAIDEGGLAAWLQAGVNVFRAQQRERAQPTLMRVLFPRGVPFGLMGDGSNDRSMVEQEAVVLRFMGDEGKPYNTFFDLASLDLSTSADGRSPDADCIASCYAGSMSELNKFEGFLHLSDWKKSLVGSSFDGASVMMGEFNGVAKKLADMTDGNLVIVHAVAHVQQLADGDAFSNVEYYEEWRGTMQEVYVHYHASGKKRFSLEAAANEIGTKLLKFATTHGIRWAAAQQNTIKAMSTLSGKNMSSQDCPRAVPAQVCIHCMSRASVVTIVSSSKL